MGVNFFKKYGWWLLLLAATFFWHSNHIMDSDEGIVLAGAWRIFQGERIYGDFFALVTPGAYYTLAFLWKLTGVSYWSANTLSIGLIFFTALGLYRLSRFFVGKFYFLVPVFFLASSLAWPIISYYIYNLFFLVWATFYWFKFLEKNHYPYLLSAGLLSALSLLFLQSKGLVFIVAVLVFLAGRAFICREKKFWRYFFYYGFSSLAPILLLFLFWPPTLLADNLLMFPLQHYSEIIRTPLYLWYFFVLVWAVTAVALRQSKDQKIYWLLWLQLALLLAVRALPDWFHISLSIFPLYILGPLWLSRFWLRSQPERFFMSAGIMAIAFFMALPSLLEIGQPPFRSVNQHPLFRAVDNYCSTDPYIYAGPFIPTVYFEARKKNATAFDWLITNHHTAEQFLAARDALADKNPACAVISPLFVGKYNYNFANPVDDYIRQHYKLEWSMSNFEIWRRVESIEN